MTDEMHLKDIANAAATLLEAAQTAPDRALDSVDASLSGPATVVVDDQAVDVTLREDGASVHVRFDGE
jgi:tRNA A37 threonylcarbamoyladenosine synthetase subunit TsaC/SUA5/YrdC